MNLSLQAVIVLAVVGLLAGWLAGLVTRERKRGLFGNLVVGVLGALLASWLFGLLGVHVLGGLLGQIVEAFVGAVLLLGLLRALRR